MHAPLHKLCLCSNPELANIAPFWKMKNKIKSYIRRRNPALPKHIVELPEVLQSGLWKEALKYNITEEGPTRGTNVISSYTFEVESVIDEDGFVHVIFYAVNFLLILKNNTIIIFFIDATFKIVPPIDGAYQFLTFMCEVYGKVIKYKL